MPFECSEVKEHKPEPIECRKQQPAWTFHPTEPAEAQANIVPLRCHECGKMFTRQMRYDEHLRTHTGERPYICNFADCNKTFIRKTHVERHVLTHLDVKPVACSAGCGKTFTTLQKMRKHLTSHDRQCTECNRKFKSESLYDLHMRFHTEASVSCPECPELFSDFDKCVRHMARCHDPKPMKTYPCSDCVLEFSKYSDLYRHRRDAHPNHHSCNDCGKAYRCPSELRNHVNTKHKGMRISCTHENCGESFTSKYNLSVHVRVKHEGRKMFICPCGEEYAHRSALNRHRRAKHVGPDGLEVFQTDERKRIRSEKPPAKKRKLAMKIRNEENEQKAKDRNFFATRRGRPPCKLDKFVSGPSPFSCAIPI